MGTKMKGLLKGIRYISQIFDDDKEQDMQIGLPTDVKHVAHIGWDGPSVDTPGWMKEFKSPHECQSAPLNSKGEPQETPEIQWVSQDSGRKNSRSRSSSSKDATEMPKSSRRNHPSKDGSSTGGSPTQEGSSRLKSRQSRKNTSDSSKSTRHKKESSLGSESTQNQPDVPKKSRRIKSKDSMGSRRSSRSKANAASTTKNTDINTDTCSDLGNMDINTDTCSDLGPETESVVGYVSS